MKLKQNHQKPMKIIISLFQSFINMKIKVMVQVKCLQIPVMYKIFVIRYDNPGLELVQLVLWMLKLTCK